MMSLQKLAIPLVMLFLAGFTAQPVLAHCGKCGMGEEKGAHQMVDKQEKPADCRAGMKQEKHDCQHCALRDEGDRHGAFKCAECAKEGHAGHHGMHHQGDNGGSLDELFEKDKS